MKITFKNEGGIKTFSDLQKLKEFYQQQTWTIGNVKGSLWDKRRKTTPNGNLPPTKKVKKHHIYGKEHQVYVWLDTNQ